MSYRFDPEEMARLMRESRRETEGLFKLVKSESDLRRPPAEGFRPILWHLGHVGAFEGYWVLQRVKGDASISPAYDVIFDPIKTPREESKSLPSRSEMENYLAGVRKRALRHLDDCQFDDADPLLRDGYIFRLVLEHEQQHQETLCYLLHLLNPKLKTRPTEASERSENDGGASSSVIARAGEMASVPAGEFVMGSPIGETGRLDVEGPQRLVKIEAAFDVGVYAVTVDDSGTDPVVMAWPIRDKGTCEVLIPKDRYDPKTRPGSAQTGSYRPPRPRSPARPSDVTVPVAKQR